jgi:RecA-family ATPase
MTDPGKDFEGFAAKGGNGKHAGNGQDAGAVIPDLLDLPTFLASFLTPEYVVDGILQRGRLYALTSLTGHGKTAVSLLIAAMVASGRKIGPIETFQGRVVLLAGENPDDVCQRLHAVCETSGLDPAKLPIEIMPGAFPLTAENAEIVRIKITQGGPVSLIIADTAAAYFDGDDDNHNVQAGSFARNLRVLIGCTGRPAVLVPCHPVKSATQDNLIPRGGGAFLNEVDVNLTLWSAALGEVTALHWHAKLRGADFQPIDFAMRKVTLRWLKDAHKRPILSIIAAFQDATQAERASETATADENTVLEWLRRHPGISIGDIARNAGWMTDKDPRQPLKSKVHRLLERLRRDRLVKLWRGKWKITDAGKKELKGENNDD